MDFALSVEQEILRHTAREFMEKECPKNLVRAMEADELGYSPELWRRMADLGWLGLPFPEKYGGSGGSFLDLAVLLEEMGRACLPSPFLSTVVLAGLTILEVGDESQKEAWLPRIAAGDIIYSLAWLEPSDDYEPSGIDCQAVMSESGYLINGIKLFVTDAHIADYLMVVARAGDTSQRKQDIVLLLVDASSPGITYAPLKTIAGDKQFEVKFSNVKAPRDSLLIGAKPGSVALSRMLGRAVLAKCAEMVGGMQQILEMTVRYASTRVQFGRPIGSFQIIQHYCASMATDVDGARFNTYKAAWMMSQGRSCKKEVAVAKAWTNEAYHRVTAAGHQIHGAIAFTRDMDVELYVRRAKAAEFAFGNTDFHLERIAEELGL